MSQSETSDCIEFSGYTDAGGYGQVVHKKLMYPAHRVAYANAHGIEIDDPEFPQVVMHTCDNPPCVNPDHLRGGTHKDNVHDMIAKGRKATKLTEQQVREIRIRYAEDAYLRQKDIAKEYGVGATAIGNITSGRSWSHVGGPRIQKRWSRKSPSTPLTHLTLFASIVYKAAVNLWQRERRSAK